jgi:ATP-dependent Lhr-like helicase
MNDCGFELLFAQAFDWAAQLQSGLLSLDELEHDILASLNSSELSTRRFREMVRVAGLVFPGHPGQQKSARQLQASSGLFYEIFRNHDSGNLLLNQADDEVLLQEFDAQRIRIALERMNASRVVVTPGPRSQRRLRIR